MVVFTEKIFYSENIKERKRAGILGKLEKGKGQGNIFCITSPTNPETLFDIIPSKELFKRFYENDEVKIAGIAKGKDEACELAGKMVEAMYAATAGFDTKSFFFDPE
jgi:hypothetical protein